MHVIEKLYKRKDSFEPGNRILMKLLLRRTLVLKNSIEHPGLTSPLPSVLQFNKSFISEKCLINFQNTLGLLMPDYLVGYLIYPV